MTQTSTIAFDPRDANFRADPYPTYRAMRQKSPLYFRPQHQDWIVTSYAEVVALEKDPRLVGPWSGGQVPVAPPALAHLEPSAGFLWELRRQGLELRQLWMVLNEPPNHTRFRKVLQNTLVASQVEAMRERIQTLAETALDRVEAQGEMDVALDLSLPLTFTVIADLLGIPENKRSALRQVAYHISFLCDIDTSPLALERGLMAMARLMEFWKEFQISWRANPVEGAILMSALMQGWDEGHISEAELLSQYSLLLFAGHATSHYLINNSVLALLRNADQFQMLREQPELFPQALEEFLRFDGPVQVKAQVAIGDVEIAGETIRAGQPVHLMLAAANHDPLVFPHPEHLDITRKSGPHLSFGRGIHYCLGSFLGRLETEIAITTLLRRFPRLRLQHQPPVWDETFLLRGLKSLPVSFD